MAIELEAEHINSCVNPILHVQDSGISSVKNVALGIREGNITHSLRRCQSDNCFSHRRHFSAVGSLGYGFDCFGFPPLNSRFNLTRNFDLPIHDERNGCNLEGCFDAQLERNTAADSTSACFLVGKLEAYSVLYVRVVIGL